MRGSALFHSRDRRPASWRWWLPGYQPTVLSLKGFFPGKTRREKNGSLLWRRRADDRHLRSPHRISQTLSALCAALGEDRRVVVARELTKIHEEFWRGTLGEAVRIWETREKRGEFTLVLEGKRPAAEELIDYAPFYREIVERKAEGEKPSAVIREIAAREGLVRSELYQYYLDKTKKEGDLL